MKILHISAECYPVAKVGGLADVVGSLPKYQNNLNCLAQVIMPFYDNKFTRNNEFSVVFESSLNLGKTTYDFRIVNYKASSLGFDLFLVDVPQLLFKNYVYSSDDTDRFLAFQIAVLDWILTWEEKPTVVHCHDHHTGLIPFMMQESYKYNALKKISSVLTIHNAQYQGWFSHDKVYMVPEFNFNNVGLLDWGGVINPLAAAIKCAWRVTTVSPTYMEELKSSANGLEVLLSHESAKCVGILNGIDSEIWNPVTDSFLIDNFNADDVFQGHLNNKKWLCDKFDLEFDKPLFTFIGRLVGEKGVDKLPESFKKTLQKNECAILLLGSGLEIIENQLNELCIQYKGTYNSFIGYDEELAHVVYGGADFLLMPSRVEPCGLNQMYALRYGTIPVVRSIGGLKDTVIDISEENGYGICFDSVTVSDITHAIERAVELYQDQSKFKELRKYIMGLDHSWNKSAQEYINLYKTINS